MADRETYAPFVLVNDDYRSLRLSEAAMLSRGRVFDERSQEGWEGNGYDWTLVAQVVVTERLPHLRSALTFDPEAGTFSAQGSLEALQELGAQMKRVCDDEAELRDLLSRPELD